MHESFWSASAKLPTYGPPKSDVEVDLIVVGGGITGITTAYLAKKAGKTVALLERARCASVDTAFTTAHLTAVTDLRLFEIASTFGKDVAHATWDAGIAAIDRVVSNIRAEGIECDFHWVPGYLHAPLREPDPKRIDDLTKEAEVARELGISAELLGKIPFFDLPGIAFRHQALFHPLKYLSALLKTIPGDGSHVFEQSNADEFSDDPLSIKTGDYTIRGKYIVIATHNPLTGNSGLFKSMMFQTKLALYSSYVVSGKVPSGTVPEASFWDTSDPYDYLRVDRRPDHDYIIFGGEDHKTGLEQDTQAPFIRLERRLRTFLPQLSLDRQWSGQVIETNDGLPFIGEAVENQFIATGFSGNGTTFGTLAAMMAVDAMLKRENPWKDIFDPHRAKILGGTWTYIKENKDYPFHLLRDRLARGEGDSVDQLARGEGKILKLEGKKVAAYRDEAGKVTLCSPVCTHLKCIVDWNTAEKTWDCPCHGSRFRPTGEVISGPAEEPLEKI
ncbi:MAG TPA: FAD-dependent oxidoreductase [Opitutaceae bacterium]|nr:FAD-dependent oxidoreductase [Opitutaceae bacterium]